MFHVNTKKFKRTLISIKYFHTKNKQKKSTGSVPIIIIGTLSLWLCTKKLRCTSVSFFEKITLNVPSKIPQNRSVLQRPWKCNISFTERCCKMNTSVTVIQYNCHVDTEITWNHSAPAKSLTLLHRDFANSEPCKMIAFYTLRRCTLTTSCQLYFFFLFIYLFFSIKLKHEIMIQNLLTLECSWLVILLISGTSGSLSILPGGCGRWCLHSWNSNGTDPVYCKIQ